MGRFSTFLFGSTSMLVTSWAYACPLCHTTTADEVRAGIQATSQDGTVVVALLGPFIALSIVLSLLNRFTPDQAQHTDNQSDRRM